MLIKTYCVPRGGSNYFSLAPVWASAHGRGAKPSWRRVNGLVRSSARLSENDKGIRISMDVPGVKSSDIKVEIQNDSILCVSGKRHMDQETSWTFQKRFSINANRIDVFQIKAHLSDGVLVLTAPKKLKLEGPKTIAIVEGEPQRDQDEKDSIPDMTDENSKEGEKMKE